MPRKGPKGLTNPHASSGQPRMKGRNREPQSRENAVLCEARAAAKRKRKGEKRLTQANRTAIHLEVMHEAPETSALEYQPDE